MLAKLLLLMIAHGIKNSICTSDMGFFCFVLALRKYFGDKTKLNNSSVNHEFVFVLGYASNKK